LLLDEPTNHLDLMSLMWFRNYLKNYPGAILMISHDRDFMDELVQNVYEIEESKLIPYQGNYSDYLRKREENYERAISAWKNQQKEIERCRSSSTASAPWPPRPRRRRAASAARKDGQAR
jgi:ATP-binding cassette subfamily F protein 3